MLSFDDTPSEKKMWVYSWTKQAWHRLIETRSGNTLQGFSNDLRYILVSYHWRIFLLG